MIWAFVLGFFLGGVVALIGLSLARMGSEDGVHRRRRRIGPQ